MNKFLSRKFMLAIVFGLVGCVLALMGRLDGIFTAFAGTILGTFTLGDAAINHIHKDKANPDDPQG